MRAPGSDENRLIAGLRRGDAESWNRLCETYGEALYRFAFHRSGGDSQLADDIRQETLLAAADAIQSFRGEAPLFGWLCAIARRKVADELRRRGRMTELPDREQQSPATGWDSPGREPLPEEWLERDEHRAAIVEALWSLPGEYRTALILRYAEGGDVESIARRLSRSYKAAESLLARARAALREKLIEVDHDDT